MKLKAIGYHGVSNMKFAPKQTEGYATDFIPMKYAQSYNPGSQVESVEQYGDNRLLCRIPSDKGLSGEIGTTAQDPALELAAGYLKEGANGQVTTNVVDFLRGALYYEFIEIGPDKKSYAVKVWQFNAEVGKGAANHATDKGSIEFGSYSYPIVIYGDPLMDTEGSKEYVDENGMGRTAFQYCSRPGDDGYADFDKTVPVPKVKAAAPAPANVPVQSKSAPAGEK